MNLIESAVTTATADWKAARERKLQQLTAIYENGAHCIDCAFAVDETEPDGRKLVRCLILEPRRFERLEPTDCPGVER